MNDLINEINKLPGTPFKTNTIIYLIYLKYLCETKQYTYNEIINSNKILIDIPLIERSLNNTYKNINSVNKLLQVIKDKDSKTLLLEYLNTLKKPINYHNNNDNVLYVSFYDIPDKYYNINGNSSYLTYKEFSSSTKIFKLFDKILGINNKYIKEISEIKDYDYIYIYDNIPKSYISERIKLFDYILISIKQNKNIILHTSYYKISNFNEGRYIYRYISKIIIGPTDIIFNNNNNNEISIINYDNINDPDKLNTIIKNNRKQKDILVKITYKDLKDNNLRIGFNLYQLEKEEIDINKKINKIVDENTNYIKQLIRINDTIEQEINTLLNK